ncbi:MAG: NAD(P)H-dependent oxidoreductase subunit E [Kiritimatiellae bacterium]|nr:NAD(P)H-dependent oxidoreductase subunit E [Kiritimatiellia bacterium]
MIAPREEKGAQVGAVLVIGGGVAGIQAALDLAESGQKVYLLENRPAIGGHMARLDKTYPTNDCSMCILAPKLVEAGRHLNIEVIAHADLIGLEGEPGRFKAAINRRARYVDGTKCTGCGLCVEQCPVQYAIYEDPKDLPPVVLEARDKNIVDPILAKHRTDQNGAILVLKDINATLGYLPENVLRYAARELEIPLSLLYRLATFYSAFSLVPRGRHVISVCLGTTCYVRGAGKLMSRIEQELEIQEGQTTPDMRFTLRSVRCLGCCSLAPVITVDGETYAKVAEKEIPKILDPYE